MQDRERGVVWEETIIFMPKGVGMVFLSATLSNATEFAAWVAHLHKVWSAAAGIYDMETTQASSSWTEQLSSAWPDQEMNSCGIETTQAQFQLIYLTCCPQAPCHVVYTDYRPTPLQFFGYALGSDGLYMIIDERGQFK
jgi:superfamily II RNA helicase